MAHNPLNFFKPNQRPSAIDPTPVVTTVVTSKFPSGCVLIRISPTSAPTTKTLFSLVSNFLTYSNRGKEPCKRILQYSYANFTRILSRYPNLTNNTIYVKASLSDSVVNRFDSFEFEPVRLALNMCRCHYLKVYVD